jgi:hypothetical protein
VSTTFSLSQDSSITWIWQGSAVQYSLTVVSGHGSPSPSVGGHSYSSGSYVTCSVSSPVTVGGTAWVCSGWTGTGSVPSSGSGVSTSFSITRDSVITWIWQVVQPQRKLTIVSAYGSPNPAVGDHYYSNGQSVGCSVSSPVTENGTTWVCTGWSGSGSVPSSGNGSSVPSFSITQNSNITWNWQIVQYTLMVASAHSDSVPSVGIHNYNSGSLIACSVNSPIIESGMVWTCTGWSGTGSVPASGSGTNVSFVVTQNSSITWLWSESALSLPPTLSAPADGVTLSSTNVTLSWSSSVGVTEYQIEINGPSSKIETVHSSSYSAILSSGAYTWRVREYNSTGYGDWSLTRSFTVSVSMIGTESYDASILFGGILATALIIYVIVFLKFGLVLERPRIRQDSLQKENEAGS